jgi:hypothetical protein
VSAAAAFFLPILFVVLPVFAHAQAAPAWQPGTPYAVNALVTYDAATYGCLQAHTSQVGWEPPHAPALWQPLSSTPTAPPTASPTPRPRATSTATPRATATSRPTATPTSGGNLARGRTVAVSSTEAAGLEGSRAIDGNLTTRWSSAFGDPQWISVDLGSNAPLGRVVLHWEAAHGRAYQIQTSADGTSWTSLYSTTTGDGGIDDVPVSGTGRYVRVHGTARGTVYGYSLWEIEVYGPTGATPTATPTARSTARATASARPRATSTATARPTPTTAPRALIVIDQRLYALVGSLVDQYRALAQARRGFEIGLRVVSGVDDWSYAQVKSYLVNERGGNPTFEGVLFIGNVKLPSFYKSRNDSNFTRLIPRYYEDLDGVFAKVYPDNSTDPYCTDTNWPNCFIYGPSNIPPHDFDFTDKGPNPDPEIWVSFLPVGSATAPNTYAEYANTLTPYLQKVIRYYNRQITTNRRYYFVTPDKGETFEILWDAFGKYAIDIYGKPGPNGETWGACLTPTGNVCYQRWPLESYADPFTFMAEYDAVNVGEGWQDPAIFLSHLNAQTYLVAEVNIHSDEYYSLASAAQARGITKGGLLVSLAGCSVSGFRQPGSPSFVDTAAFVSDSVAAAYLYGSSNAVAVLGDPFWRGHYAHFPTLYREMTLYGQYLGAAHLVRMKRQYALSETGWDLRENGMEMLMGDPFMDLNP